MFKRRKHPTPAETCMAGIRHDLYQLGASPSVINEVESIRQRSQFEALQRRRHLENDTGIG